MKPSIQRSRGFTLVELVLVMSVIAIMAAALIPIARNSMRAYDQTLGDVIVLDKLRYATERLAREIREVTYDEAAATFGFTAASAGSMAFTRNFVDSAGNTSSAAVTVGNTGSSVTLAYSTLPGIGAQVLTDEMSSLAFDYLTDAGVSLSPASLATLRTAVRSVQITLTLTRDGQTYVQRTQVELKNVLSL